MTSLLLLTALAPACPPPWVVVWVCPPPVVYYYLTPCPCPPAVSAPAAAPVSPAPKPAAPPPARTEAPKPQPRVEADPTPFKPAGSTDPKPADPPTLPPLVIPNTPTPKPATPAPVVPAVPSEPKGLDLKPVNPGAPAAPPLTLPKETRTSFRLPAPPSARLVPAAGPAPASPDTKRQVVFVNLTGAAVRLTVEGEAAVLPARHELTATVPARFRWQLDDGESRSDEVPAAAPGASVVIRPAGR